MKHNEANEFQECEACAAKPGSPTLCPACLHNRKLIGQLQHDVEWLWKALQHYTYLPPAERVLMGQPYRCPICEGRGMVAGGFYSSPPGCPSVGTSAAEICRQCWGAGVICTPHPAAEVTYSGHVYCGRCNTGHRMYGPCATKQQ